MWIYKKNYKGVNKKFKNYLIEQNEDYLVYNENEEKSHFETILNN